MRGQPWPLTLLSQLPEVPGTGLRGLLRPLPVTTASSPTWHLHPAHNNPMWHASTCHWSRIRKVLLPRRNTFCTGGLCS